MMRSLFSGVSGLLVHQTRMDVIGNNIANVNTVGYKTSRVTFQDMLYQTLRAATAPSMDRGGTNPRQVGLGVQLGTIDVIHSPGNLQPTGVATDLAIRGNGFFILMDGSQQYYTRAGVFDFDQEGWLVSKASGMRVAGWNADPVSGVVDTNKPLEEIRIALDQTLPARPTTKVELTGNLSAEGGTVDRSISVYDSLGTRHEFVIRFTQSEQLEWQWEVISTSPLLPMPSPSQGTITFKPDGTFASDSGGTINFTGLSNGANDMVITLDFSKLTMFSGLSDVSVRSQDGFPPGSLEEIRIDATGKITGIFSNGLTQVLAQLATATFANPGGLEQVGETAFRESHNSGMPRIGTPGTADRGFIASGTVEMSNVDLSEEFTQMIITQRGFQANSRIITTSDEMLQELVNLKR